MDRRCHDGAARDWRQQDTQQRGLSQISEKRIKVKRYISQRQSQSGSMLELLEIWRHRLVLVCYARLALAPYPTVLADAPPSAFLALAPYPSVLADARPAALLARAPLPSVLADARPSALLALAPYPSVLAHARPSALLALAHLPLVLALPWLEP